MRGYIDLTLGIPSQISPGNGAEVKDTTVLLVWSQVSGATMYELQIATDASFSATAIVKDMIQTGTSDLAFA